MRSYLFEMCVDFGCWMLDFTSMGLQCPHSRTYSPNMPQAMWGSDIHMIGIGEKRLRSPQVARGCGREKMHTKSMSLSKNLSKVDSLDPIFANRCRRIPTSRSLSPPRRLWPPASSLRPLASQPPASSAPPRIILIY